MQLIADLSHTLLQGKVNPWSRVLEMDLISQIMYNISAAFETQMFYRVSKNSRFNPTRNQNRVGYNLKTLFFSPKIHRNINCPFKHRFLK